MDNFTGFVFRPWASKCAHRRRRRRCGPPVGRTRSPSPSCLLALTDLDRRSMRGTLTAGPVWCSIMVEALLFVCSPWAPDPRNTPAVCWGYHSGSPGGGLGWSRFHTWLAADPPRRVDTRAGCEPLAHHQVLRKGGVWPAGQGGLVRHSVAPPPTHRPRACGLSAPMQPWYVGRFAHQTPAPPHSAVPTRGSTHRGLTPSTPAGGARSPVLATPGGVQPAPSQSAPPCGSRQG